MTRRLFSFVLDVIGQGDTEIDCPEVGQTLGPGRNAFTATLEDVDAFRKSLEDLGVKVVEINVLDDIEPIPEDVIKEQNPELIPYFEHKKLLEGT